MNWGSEPSALSPCMSIDMPGHSKLQPEVMRGKAYSEALRFGQVQVGMGSRHRKEGSSTLIVEEHESSAAKGGIVRKQNVYTSGTNLFYLNFCSQKEIMSAAGEPAQLLM